MWDINCQKNSFVSYIVVYVKKLNQKVSKIEIDCYIIVKVSATLQLIALREANRRSRYTPLSKDLFHLNAQWETRSMRKTRRPSRPTFFVDVEPCDPDSCQFPFTTNQSRYSAICASSVCTTNQRNGERKLDS